MTIITEKLPSIESLKSLPSVGSLNKLVPSISELMELSKVKNVEPFVYHASDNKKTYAAAVFVFERRQIHKANLNTFSLLGYDYFDYNFFFCTDNIYTDFLNFISIDAKKIKADAIILENIVLDIEMHQITEKQRVHHFNAYSNLEKGFQSILQKQSLKRHHNKVTRSFDYSCEHKLSKFNNEDIEILGKLHKERWCFDEIKSAFCETERNKLYLSYKDNKILTILRNQHDVIAMHYGMILGDVLLWHTPSINIKYLEYSPIELLLFELAKFCKDNHFSILDYGLGNEKYKERFANSYREVGYRLHPISYKGQILNFCTRWIDPKTIEKSIYTGLASVKGKIRKVSVLANKINYYILKKRHYDENVSKKEGENKLVIIKNFMDLVEIFRNNKMTPKRFHYNRIKSGDMMLCLINESFIILSYGWATKKEVFFVSESNKNICNKGKLMLYDFNTPVELQGKGYYTFLLKKIAEQLSEEKLVIFSEKKNVPSNKAILRAGFISAEDILYV